MPRVIVTYRRLLLSLFAVDFLAAELPELPAFLLLLLVRARNTGELLRRSELPRAELRLPVAPHFTFVLSLMLVLLPGAAPLAGFVLGLTCTEPFAVDKFGAFGAAVARLLLLKRFRDCAGILVFAGLGPPRTCLVGRLLRGDTTLTPVSYTHLRAHET